MFKKALTSKIKKKQTKTIKRQMFTSNQEENSQQVHVDCFTEARKNQLNTG